MLHYQIYIMHYTPKGRLLKLSKCTIRWWLTNGVLQPVLLSCQFKLHSDTDLQIEVKQSLFEGANLFKSVDDKWSWITCIGVLDLIYHHFFFTAICLGHKPTTSQHFQLLTPQIIALAEAAISCTLSEYPSRKTTIIMSFQDEYHDIFCSSPGINITPEATPLINYRLVRRFIPPPHPVVYLCWNRRFSIPVGTPQPRLTFFCSIAQSIAPLSALLHWDWHSITPTFWIGTTPYHFPLHTPSCCLCSRR
jgi:hypothetical protein